MRMLLIEERAPGRYRLANGPMTLEVYGSSIEELLIQAMKASGVGGGEQIDVFHNSYSVSLVLDTLMGAPEPVTWNKNGADVEGHSV